MTARDSFRFEDTRTVPRFEENSEKNMDRGSRMAVTIQDQFENYIVSHEGQVERKYNNV